jgi:hypothetical protein
LLYTKLKVCILSAEFQCECCAVPYIITCAHCSTVAVDTVNVCSRLYPAAGEASQCHGNDTIDEGHRHIHCRPLCSANVCFVYCIVICVLTTDSIVNLCIALCVCIAYLCVFIITHTHPLLPSTGHLAQSLSCLLGMVSWADRQGLCPPGYTGT